MTEMTNGTNGQPPEGSTHGDHLPVSDAIQKFEELREEAIAIDDKSTDEQDEP